MADPAVPEPAVADPAVRDHLPPAVAGAARRPPRAGAPGASAPARATATKFLQTCLEIINGLRPPTHMRAISRPLEAAAVVSALALAARRLRRAARAASPPERLIRLRRMRTCQPHPRVIEIAAVIGNGERAWAGAFRLERGHAGWQCTAAAIL